MIMTVEEALGLVEEVKNCSLPWDDAHWDALCMVINYVKDKLHEDFQNTWKPSGEQMHYLYWIANIKLGDSVVEQEVSKHLNELYEDLKKLRKE